MPKRHDDDLLAYADRLVLEIAREHGGQVDIEVYREGVKDPDADALCAHCHDMCGRGFLSLVGVYGTKARMQGARQAVAYRWTDAGELVLELADRLEATAGGADVRPPRARSGSSRARRRSAPRPGPGPSATGD